MAQIKKAQSGRKGKPVLAPTTPTGIRSQQDIGNLELPEPSPPHPQHKELTMPADLSETSLDHLSLLLTGWTSLHNYASYQAMLVRNDKEFKEAQLTNFLEAKMMTFTDADTITVRKMRARAFPDARNWEREIAHLEAVYNLLQTLCAGYERNYQATSREISRRGTGLE
jgi:hypothetical protein